MQGARERADGRRAEAAVETAPVARVAEPGRPSLAALQAVVVLPAVPVLVASCVVGHLSADHLITGFDMMFTLWPAELLFSGIAFLLAAHRIFRWHESRRLTGPAAALVLALTLLALVATWWTSPGGTLGRRFWERTELAPRAGELRALAPPHSTGPLSVAGLTFPRVASAPEGLLLYTVVGGGPWPGWGILVPRGDVRPESGRDRWVRPTSVEGLYWFTERF